MTHWYSPSGVTFDIQVWIWADVNMFVSPLRSTATFRKSSYKYQPINQSINGEMKRTINQSINQSINPGTNQSRNQSINQSINQLIHHVKNGGLIRGLNYICQLDDVWEFTKRSGQIALVGWVMKIGPLKPITSVKWGNAPQWSRWKCDIKTTSK